MSGLLEHLKSQVGAGRFLKDNGEPNTEVIQKWVSKFYLL